MACYCQVSLKSGLQMTNNIAIIVSSSLVLSKQSGSCEKSNKLKPHICVAQCDCTLSNGIFSERIDVGDVR